MSISLPPASPSEVTGTIRLADGSPAAGLSVVAIDRDLRSEQPLGDTKTDRDGTYRIEYRVDAAAHAERGTADLVIRVLGPEGAPLAASPVLFNAPPAAVVDLTLPVGALPSVGRFDAIAEILAPLIEDVPVADLEEDAKHQDVSFLSGETALDRTVLGRYVLAHRLTRDRLPAEFWFVLLGGGLFEWTDGRTVAEQLAEATSTLLSLDPAAARRALARGLATGEIASSLGPQVPGWIEAFASFLAEGATGSTDAPTFLGSALDLAGVDDAGARETVARLAIEHRGLTAELIAALRREEVLGDAQLADLRASIAVRDVTDAGFDVVRAVREEFGVRRPEDVPALAKQPVDAWVKLIETGAGTGEIAVPVSPGEVVDGERFPAAAVYGRALAQQVQEAFPTQAFAGGLERALESGDPVGIRHGEELRDFLDRHPTFDLVRTPIDEFLDGDEPTTGAAPSTSDDFRQELKAVQRVNKLAGSFQATDALLSDGLHSARQVYRLGETEFVRRYGDRADWTPDDARRAWRRAADTHAAVLTIVGDLAALDGGAMPAVLQHDATALASFPNWENLFRTGDTCSCGHCDSVLSPAAYFADIMMFLKDRSTTTSGRSVKDVLLDRRPDLDFLELGCDNALTPLPYVDVVCEVLEAVVAAGADDVELAGLTSIPADPAAARDAVAAALATAELEIGDEISISPESAADPDRRVAHGDRASYLLQRGTTSNFTARVLRNTKRDAEELRAYPQYVSPAAYETLRQAVHPFALPFDLFGEEVRASFSNSRLRRSELMQGLRSTTGPSDAEVAAEYLRIGVDDAASIDEWRLTAVDQPTDSEQQVVWGETGNSGWLDTVSNVATLLDKTRLEYHELGALIDLPFIDPDHKIEIEHLDASCDLTQKTITGLDAGRLDRMHRFLRLWRKLDGWAIWELDLVIRCTSVGNGTLDEACLIQLSQLVALRARLGARTTVAALCALVDPLSTETYFVDFLEPRGEGPYQRVFLDARVTHPLDPALAVAAVDVAAPTMETVTGHTPAILAALRLRQADLDLLLALPSVSGDLTLDNLTLLWRHSWLARQLKLSVPEWLTTLALLGRRDLVLADARDARELLGRIDALRSTGLSLDQLAWLLMADRAARSAMRESDAERFLAALRTGLRTIQSEYDPARYPFLAPPSERDQLAALLTALLQQLHRDEPGAQLFLGTLRDDVALTAPVTGMPAGFIFPNVIALTIGIGYDEAAGVLRFRGLMSAAERTTLLGDPSLAAVTGIPSYQAAVAALFDGPRLALRFLDPVFTAPLATLPETVDFASLDRALAQRISYDSQARVLRLVGILSPDERAMLDTLSSDVAYRTAVSDLFAQPTGPVEPGRVWLDESDLLFPLRDLDDPAADNLDRNLSTAIQKALAYLSRSLSAGLVIREASAELGLGEALGQRLLTEYAVLPDTLLAMLTGPFAQSDGSVEYVTMQPLFDGWFWAARVALLWKRWKLGLTEWDLLHAIEAGGQLLDPLTLPLTMGAAVPPTDTLVRTARLVALRDALPETELTLFELLATLGAGTYASVAAFAADVERVNDAWPAGEVEALIGIVDLTFPGDYLLAESWERARGVFGFARALNADMATLATLAGPTMGPAQARTVGRLLRSGLEPDRWRALSEQIQDVMRVRKRDALVAYLLAQPIPADAPSGKWDSPNDLYAYYLLDVEMDACLLTSRLVQGSGSVQLLVQRCLMGLEPEVDASAEHDSAWSWWRWMARYRVWEANRKVFLWPENWIEPELRRDRSPIFEELEQELLQDDVTAESAEATFARYVEKLHGVARLEIAGFYQEDDGDDTILHVFGRTQGAEPHVYYYRRFDYRRWSPWEPVNLEIHGDYLVPAVVDRRLYLFWPVFTEAPDEASNSTVPTPSANQSAVPVHRTIKRQRVQLAMSEYRRGAWSPKRVSKDVCESGWINEIDVVRKFYFFAPIDRTSVDGRFHVRFDGYSLGSDGYEQGELHGTFEIGGCSGVPELIPAVGSYRPVLAPEWASVGQFQGPDKRYTGYMKWRELGMPDEFGHLVLRHDGENDFTLENAFPFDPGARFTQVLLQTPWLYRMSPPWQLSLFDRLLLDGLTGLLTSARSTDALSSNSSQLSVPIGSWLPYFYDDRKRAFVVLPVIALPRGGPDATGAPTALDLALLYYPDVKRIVLQLEAQFGARVDTWLTSFDLLALTADQRLALDQRLASAFPGEAPPTLPAPPSPYSAADAERVRPFIRRYLMRFYHAFLGTLTLRLFGSRRFHFRNFYHPFTCDLLALLQSPRLGVRALFAREVQLQDSGFSFRMHYQPTAAVIDPSVERFYPREIMDFAIDGAYAPYNWELFFHVPLLIANSLSRNQRFEEARDWYHFIFNPLGVESATPGGSAMSRYWITKPFFETTDPQYIAQRIDAILRMLAGDATEPGFSAELRQRLEEQVRDWRDHPFEPHRLASFRTVAYQKTVLMKYLDNLVAWGDTLFRQDSMESIAQATQLYVLAAELLGPRPATVPPCAKPALETFNELESTLDVFSNALVQVENLVPPQPGTGNGTGTNEPPLPMLYFCVPQNDKLLGYWDTVADRLYKIRHCMNIEGVLRQLALFEPPIDPGILVKGIAAGADPGNVLADLNAPLPLYRFPVLLQKANESCADVKALGSALLAALQARDAEALARLRQDQEIQLLQAVRAVKSRQIDEAHASLEGARQARALAEQKRAYFASREFMNVGEKLAITLAATGAAMGTAVQLGFALSSTARTSVPQFTVGGAGFGGSPVSTITYGGQTVGDAGVDASQALMAIAGALEKAAAISGTVAGYQRRRDDWEFQRDLAELEIAQDEQAIAAAEARVAIAERELENHDLQIENAQEMDEFMRSRFTNVELFAWQVGQISQLFFRSYQLAYDLARRAERCFRFELGLEDSAFITFGYWDSLRRGLLSGERLQLDLRRLETAYLEQNRREFELTKHLSLLQLDPLALVQLRETGRCFFALPEELFDLDYPGHYFRRIKSVSLTLPSVTGPYTTVSCTLRLMRNSIRQSPAPGTQYARNVDDAGLPTDDERFAEHGIPVAAIAASGARDDSGLFELGFRDERYLPFEGAGVISGWSLELFTDPADPDSGAPLRQFDYDAISDAVLHVKYTSREDAGPLKTSAIGHLRDYFADIEPASARLMLNLRRDFASEWSRFLHPTNGDGNVFELPMSASLFPTRDAGKVLTITNITLLGRCADQGTYNVVLTPPLAVPPPAGSNVVTLNPDAAFGGLHVGTRDVSADDVEVSPLPGEETTWRLKVTRPGGGPLTTDPATELPEMGDLLLALSYAWG